MEPVWTIVNLHFIYRSCWKDRLANSQHNLRFSDFGGSLIPRHQQSCLFLCLEASLLLVFVHTDPQSRLDHRAIPVSSPPSQEVLRRWLHSQSKKEEGRESARGRQTWDPGGGGHTGRRQTQNTTWTDQTHLHTFKQSELYEAATGQQGERRVPKPHMNVCFGNQQVKSSALAFMSCSIHSSFKNV